MDWYLVAYGLLARWAIGGLAILAIAELAVWRLREPARRAAAIGWTWLALVLLPLLSIVPGYPGWSILPPIRPLRQPAVIDDQVAIVPATPSEAELEPPRAAPSATEMDAEPVEPAAENARLVDEPAPQPATLEVAQVANPNQPANAEPVVPAEAEAIESAPKDPRPAVAPAARGAIETSDWRYWIVRGYLTGVAVMVLWSVAGLLALNRLLAGARPTDADCRQVLRDLAGPASDQIALLASPRVSQPCAFAWRRTTILLPESLCAADPVARQRLRWALLHEWSHVARGDIGVWTLGTLVRCVYFYQPFVWHLRRVLQLSQDYIADWQAATAGGSNEDYAEFLTTVVADSQGRLAAGLGIGGQPSDLHRRIVMLVERNTPLELATPRRWKLGSLAAALVIAGIAATLHEKHVHFTHAQAVAADQKDEANDDAQQAKDDARPDGPRKIAPGDTLVIEVLPNATTTKEGEIPLLLPPRLQVVVDEEGFVPLGTRYSSPHVGGSTVETAARQIQAVLADEQQKLEELERRSKGDAARRANADFINVRVALIPRSDMSEMLGARPRTQIAPGDILHIVVDGTPPEAPISGEVTVEPEGTVPLGPQYGRVNVAGKSLVEAEAAIQKHLQSTLRETKVQVTWADRRVPGGGKSDLQPTSVSGGSTRIGPGDILHVVTYDGAQPESGGGSEHLAVEPEGTVALGPRFGRAEVAGKTVAEAEAAIQKQIESNIDNPNARVRVQVTRTATRQESAPSRADAPSMRIDPGDILLLAVAGTPTGSVTSGEIRVEPSGTLPLGPRVGRLKVSGMTLAEAEAAIQEHVARTLKITQTPVRVQVTFYSRPPRSAISPANGPSTGRYLGVLQPADPSRAGGQTAVKPPVVLEPLDTVEILLSLKPKIHKAAAGDSQYEYGSLMPTFSGTYLIEPDGNISLPHGCGRVNVKGMDERQAGTAIRTRLTAMVITRTALPPVRVVKRGRAVFPKGWEFNPDYRVRVGDRLMIGNDPNAAFDYEVMADGTVPWLKQNINVAGLTLAEAQEEVQKHSVREVPTNPGGGFHPGTMKKVPWPIFLTLGGWTEHADPDVVEQLEGDEETRVQRLEGELRELKQMIRDLKP